jgi:hypothetical protein
MPQNANRRGTAGGVSEWSKEAVLKTAVDAPAECSQGHSKSCLKNCGQQNPESVLASCLALLAEKDPDLAALLTAWPMLPDALKAGIVAMVKAAYPEPRKGTKP